MFFAAAEAQTYYCRVVKLRFLSSCFEYQDLFVGSRIVYSSESYFSRKVMSEVSESRRRRSPSTRSALLLTCTPSFSGPAIEAVEKRERCSGRKTFSEENIDTEGFPRSSPRGRVGLCRGKADPSLTVRLYFGVYRKRGI
jgi:hypothetical protein